MHHITFEREFFAIEIRIQKKSILIELKFVTMGPHTTMNTNTKQFRTSQLAMLIQPIPFNFLKPSPEIPFQRNVCFGFWKI